MYIPNNTNLAYDFDMFDDEQIQKRQKQKEKAKIGIMPMSVARNGNFVKILLVAAFAVALPGSYLISKAQVSQLSADINAATVLLEEAKRENQRLQTELDNRFTLSKVEEYATFELGLEKVKSSQETHVVLNAESLSEVIGEPQMNVAEKIGELAGDIKEYLGF